MWQLKSLNIEFMAYGDYKGKFVGKIKFENGDSEAFMFNLSPEKSNEFLQLISKEVGRTASQLGEKISESMKFIETPGAVLQIN